MSPKFQKNILIILIPSAVLTLAWIIFGIYSRSVTSTISSTQTKLIVPIAPTFDTPVFDQLSTRKTIRPLLIGEEAPEDVSPTPEASRTATITPTLTQTPSASQEGGIQ